MFLASVSKIKDKVIWWSTNTKTNVLFSWHLNVLDLNHLHQRGLDYPSNKSIQNAIVKRDIIQMTSIPILTFTHQRQFWLTFGTWQVFILDNSRSWSCSRKHNDKIFCSIIHTTGAGSVWDQGFN